MAKRRSIEAAVRAKCLDCCAGQRTEVEHCTLYECPLYDFRDVEVPKAVRHEKLEKHEHPMLDDATLKKAIQSVISEVAAKRTRKRKVQ